MNSFFTLVGFEYKKIFKRKSSVIALVLAAVSAFAGTFTYLFGTTYFGSKPSESAYESMVINREYARALAGRPIDETLLAETIGAYSMVPNVENYTETPEFQQYARPYSEIIRFMRSVYGMDTEKLKGLSEAELGDFYRMRHENSVTYINDGALRDATKEKLIRLDSEIETPFIFGYTEGFDILVGCIFTFGISGSFALAVCIAPIFAGEYSSRTDQLILSSRHGKKKQVSAKLFTAISMTVGFYLFLLAGSTVLCAVIYGFDGWYAPLQLLLYYTAYFPMTVLEAVLLLALSALCGTFLVTALTLLLSSKSKSPFGVIIIISVIIFVPMMINTPESITWLANLVTLLPANMMAVWGPFSPIPFDFFGLVVLPYIFLPIFALTLGSAMLPFASRAFKNHQIGS